MPLRLREFNKCWSHDKVAKEHHSGRSVVRKGLAELPRPGACAGWRLELRDSAAVAKCGRNLDLLKA